MDLQDVCYQHGSRHFHSGYDVNIVTPTIEAHESGNRIIMHVITRKRLNEFVAQHPETRSALVQWYGIVKSVNFSSLADVRQLFPSADRVGKFTVFNVGGNKVRIIAAIHYNRRRIYIRAVLTHADYDKGKWKNEFATF